MSGVDLPLSTRGWASAATARHYNRQLWLERSTLGAVVELAAPRPADVLVDLATGTGAVLAACAALAEPPRQATGIDASAAMLGRVQTLPAGWQVIEADARRLPLPDASVDLVTCTYLLHLLSAEDRAAVLGEIRRVLVPEGRTVLATLLEPRGLLGALLLAPAQNALGRLLGPASGWRALDPGDELAAAGLALVRRRICTRGYASVCLLAVPV